MAPKSTGQDQVTSRQARHGRKHWLLLEGTLQKKKKNTSGGWEAKTIEKHLCFDNGLPFRSRKTCLQFYANKQEGWGQEKGQCLKEYTLKSRSTFESMFL